MHAHEYFSGLCVHIGGKRFICVGLHDEPSLSPLGTGTEEPGLGTDSCSYYKIGFQGQDMKVNCM